MLKTTLRTITPAPLWRGAAFVKNQTLRTFAQMVVLRGDWLLRTNTARELNASGLNAIGTRDHYSPLPVAAELDRTRQRWDRPSQLVGVAYDLGAMREEAARIFGAFREECLALPRYGSDPDVMGLGEGYTPVDAVTLYAMLRCVKPRRYVEIGSGISTYYASLAARRNAADGRPTEMTAIEPFPRPALRRVDYVDLIPSPVEQVPLTLFEKLEANDVLFIDSTHVLKIDGDVAYIYLEILPRLRPGVVIHVHDIPFPYVTPYPADTWVTGREWPMYWTEPMLLQALLCGSTQFQIRLSLPLLRHADEGFVAAVVPGYGEMRTDRDLTYSSIWLQRSGAA